MSKETKMPETKMVTADTLRDKEACADGVELFAKTFPQGAEITRASIMRAGEVGLNLDWFVQKFATAPARAEYRKAIASAQAEYDKAIAPARAEYDKATASAACVAFGV